MVYYPTYSQIHKIFHWWVLNGDFKFNGEMSDTAFTDLDEFILKFFGIRVPNNPSSETLREKSFSLLVAINDGDIRVDWLFGPHALTLFKAEMIRMQHENGP